MNELINVNIKNENGKLLVSSRDIAKGLEKEHKDILRKIRKVLDRNEYFISTYTDKKGGIRPQYFMDKNSFILLIMNYTGYNDFKRAYIRQLNNMELEISKKRGTLYAKMLRQTAYEAEQKLI